MEFNKKSSIINRRRKKFNQSITHNWIYLCLLFYLNVIQVHNIATANNDSNENLIKANNSLSEANSGNRSEIKHSDLIEKLIRNSLPSSTAATATASSADQFQSNGKLKLNLKFNKVRELKSNTVDIEITHRNLLYVNRGEKLDSPSNPKTLISANENSEHSNDGATLPSIDPTSTNSNNVNMNHQPQQKLQKDFTVSKNSFSFPNVSQKFFNKSSHNQTNNNRNSKIEGKKEEKKIIFNINSKWLPTIEKIIQLRNQSGEKLFEIYKSKPQKRTFSRFQSDDFPSDSENGSNTKSFYLVDSSGQNISIVLNTIKSESENGIDSINHSNVEIRRNNQMNVTQNQNTSDIRHSDSYFPHISNRNDKSNGTKYMTDKNRINSVFENSQYNFNNTNSTNSNNNANKSNNNNFNKNRKNTNGKVSLLGLFELTTRWGDRPEGKSELAAAQLAVKHINQRGILPGYTLELITNDTQVSSFVLKQFFGGRRQVAVGILLN